MKNKKNLYVLLPAVLIVWGLVGYRFYKGFNPDPVAIEHQTATSVFKPKQLKETASFTIKADYRDPFLGTLTKKKKSVKRKVTPKKVEPEIPFPNIAFKGIVSPKGNNQKVFLISINGRQHYFKLKNTQQEVTLIKGNEKEITLQFQKQKRTFQIDK